MSLRARRRAAALGLAGAPLAGESLRSTSSTCALVAALGLLLLSPAGATAVERCEVPPFRNALAAGGTQAAMTVVNDGGSCRIVNWIDARLRVQPDAIRTITRPQYGTVKINQPATIFYRPSPGFVGFDEFAYAGTGRTQDGRLVEMTVRVTVTVLPASALQAENTP